MDYNKVLDDLNNYDTDFDNYRIPMDVEHRKELLYILGWREYNNDGMLCGPTSIEVAKRAIEVEESGEIPVDFSFVNYNHFFVTFCGTENSVTDFENRVEYYRRCNSIARKYGTSVQRINSSVLEADLMRDLDGYNTESFERYCESNFRRLF